MLQFIIIAEDEKDAEALNRRMAARPAHLAGAASLKAADHYIIGGAVLNEAGIMAGSVMIVQFPSEAALQQWLNEEPYITGNVWKSVQVKPFKVADV